MPPRKAPATPEPALIEAIDRVNALVKAHLEAIAPGYATSLVSLTPDDNKTAAKLSRRYPRLRFTVVYEDGQVALHAQPCSPNVLDYHAGDGDAQWSAYEAQRRIAALPPADVVRAYAEGYLAAAPAASELAEAKAGIVKLKAQLGALQPQSQPGERYYAKVPFSTCPMCCR